jgi:RNA polymerase primary sigma factor
MYLREMGSVELLSREGEIAIAKRIEAGREAMIAGPVRKPADLPGHHHLARRTERRQDPAARHHRSGSHLCRPEAKQAPKVPSPKRSRPTEGGRGKGKARPKCAKNRPPPTTSPMSAAKARISKRTTTTTTTRPTVARRDGSRAEAARSGNLRPIAETYKKLRKLQDQQVENKKTGTLSPSQERRYKKLKDEI